MSKIKLKNCSLSIYTFRIKIAASSKFVANDMVYYIGAISGVIAVAGCILGGLKLIKMVRFQGVHSEILFFIGFNFGVNLLTLLLMFFYCCETNSQSKKLGSCQLSTTCNWTGFVIS